MPDPAVLEKPADDRAHADVLRKRRDTPGRSAHAPRTIRSIFTPACDASYSARITASSINAFILAVIRAGLPSRACALPGR